MKKSLYLTLLSLICLTGLMCRHNTALAPADPITPINPIFTDSIKIDYAIWIKSVDTTQVTNIVNGMGYAYTVNGNWFTVENKFKYPGNFTPVHKGKLFRGQFYIPPNLTNVRFKSALFLLSNDFILANQHNVATIQVWSNNVLIVDKRANGLDSVVWNYGRYDIGSLTPVFY